MAVANRVVLLGLFVGQGCAVDLIEPAVDPGDYALFAPEVVVLSAGLERVNVDGDRDCDDLETCFPIGIHVGHGILVDLNGHVHAVPQLLSSTGDGLAFADPEAASLGGWPAPYMERTTTGYELSAPLGARQRLIDVGDGWEFGWRPGQLPGLSVTWEGDRTVIRDFGEPRLYVQSQGDHLLLQQTLFRDRTEIRYSDDGNVYEVDRLDVMSPVQIAVTLDDRTMLSGRATRVKLTRETNAQGEQELVRTSGLMRRRTTLTEDGWIDRVILRSTVQVEGGRPVTR